jgi:hypothetical protein
VPTINAMAICIENCGIGSLLYKTQNVDKKQKRCLNPLVPAGSGQLSIVLKIDADNMVMSSHSMGVKLFIVIDLSHRMLPAKPASIIKNPTYLSASKLGREKAKIRIPYLYNLPIE